MGSWGPGLYQDDEALDLKSTIALLSKLPVAGDRLVEILLAKRDDGAQLDKDGGPTFWLVVADQFERKGIESPMVFSKAIEAIESGADLRDLEARDMGPADIRKRSKVLEELGARFRSPRPTRRPPTRKNPPPMVVEVGQAFSFPTMKNRAMNPYHRNRAQAGFEPDGWGAMLILGIGRAYDWLPWCAYQSVSVSHDREPTLDDVRKSRLWNLETAHLAVPRRSHLTRIEAKLLGRLDLNSGTVAERVPFLPQGRGPEYAVYVGWSFSLYSSPMPFDTGIPVSELLA
jgi:hypothetical protein